MKNEIKITFEAQEAQEAHNLNRAFEKEGLAVYYPKFDYDKNVYLVPVYIESNKERQTANHIYSNFGFLDYK